MLYLLTKCITLLGCKLLGIIQIKDFCIYGQDTCARNHRTRQRSSSCFIRSASFLYSLWVLFMMTDAQAKASAN